MPIRISQDLPAYQILQNENIFVMTHDRAEQQDIRPLKILILNIMPKKIETETQILRLLSNFAALNSFLPRANSRTVSPDLSFMDKSAPCSQRIFNARRFPSYAPLKRGVLPSLSAALTSTHFSLRRYFSILQLP